MVVQHVTGLSPVTEITTVIASASVAGFKTWTLLRRSAAAEHAQTRRLIVALLGARSQDHAEVISACAELEAAIGSTRGHTAKPMWQSPVRRTGSPNLIDVPGDDSSPGET
jgi:hypothetical protein